MQINAEIVKNLRVKTGAGMMDCKKALVETNGDIERAIKKLREKGLVTAAKKAGRIATEGTVGSYIHGGGRIGVLIEVNCETDFVAKTERFQGLIKDISMQIAASNPLYIKKEDVPINIIEQEKNILKAQVLSEGKSKDILEQIVLGRMDKFFKEVCLLEQPFIKNPENTIQQLIVENIAKLGENINVRRFIRYQLGEGLEKKLENFVDEVMDITKN